MPGEMFGSNSAVATAGETGGPTAAGSSTFGANGASVVGGKAAWLGAAGALSFAALFSATAPRAGALGAGGAKIRTDSVITGVPIPNALKRKRTSSPKAS